MSCIYIFQFPGFEVITGNKKGNEFFSFGTVHNPFIETCEGIGKALICSKKCPEIGLKIGHQDGC